MEEEIISAQIRWIYAEQKIYAERRNNNISSNKDRFSIIRYPCNITQKIIAQKTFTHYKEMKKTLHIEEAICREDTISASIQQITIFHLISI